MAHGAWCSLLEHCFALLGCHPWGRHWLRCVGGGGQPLHMRRKSSSVVTACSSPCVLVMLRFPVVSSPSLAFLLVMANIPDVLPC